MYFSFHIHNELFRTRGLLALVCGYYRISLSCRYTKLGKKMTLFYCVTRVIFLFRNNAKIDLIKDYEVCPYFLREKTAQGQEKECTKIRNSPLPRQTKVKSGQERSVLSREVS